MIGLAGKPVCGLAAGNPFRVRYRIDHDTRYRGNGYEYGPSAQSGRMFCDGPADLESNP